MSRHDALLVGWRRGNLQARYSMIPPATILAGKCLSCSDEVYVNESGARLLRERGADVACEVCEARYGSEITLSL